MFLNYTVTYSEMDSVIADKVKSDFEKTVTSGSSSNKSSNEEINIREKRRKNKNENDRKKLRIFGKTYLNYKNQRIYKKKKILPNPCNGKLCVSACNNFDENERIKLFENF